MATLLTIDTAEELGRCYASPTYFVETYCQILNVTEEAWIPFELWPAQREVLATLERERFVVILKARQLGLTWLCLCVQLWLMLFRPISTVGIFSRIETDAQELLDVRLKGIYDRLPDWMKADSVVEDNKSRWELSNGSVAMAFATNGGRQYTFTYILVDEADFQPDLSNLLLATKPTVDAGGRMTLLSTSDKAKPESLFKRIYRQAKQKLNEYVAVFLPWRARPERDNAWYEEKQRDSQANTGALDDLHQEYPATDTEALAPRTLDKRIPAAWIETCYQERAPLPLPANAPALPGLTIYAEPQTGHTYAIGVDPAEGNPTSDDSALAVLDVHTGEQAALLAGKIQPSTMASYAVMLSVYYNDAGLMVERNNHGHEVIGWVEQNSTARRLPGHDGKPGWMSNHLGKTILYNQLTDCFHEGDTRLYHLETYAQISSIDGSTLRAPDNAHDDLADAYALAHVGRIAMLTNVVAMRQAPVHGRRGHGMTRSAKRREAA